ncbi:hypothetical protein N431DRAFT_330177 [Stipitochalara longipes BDJ]|nr:hypothetical protein N431DRAFT_330177 [Stipitochalara longipes BDJ]
MHFLAILGVWAFATLAPAQNVNRTALTNLSIINDTWAAFDGCLPQPSGYSLVQLISNDPKKLSPGPLDSAIFYNELVNTSAANKLYCKDNFTLYTVTYLDDPTNNYTAGICSLSSRTPDSVFKLIGRLPYLLRQGIRSFVLARGTSPGFNATFSYDQNTYIDFSFSGDFGAADAIWAFATAYVGLVIDNAPWIAAVGNDTCVADSDTLAKVAVGDYFDSAITATVLAAYQAIVGPWPKDTSCMKNQLLLITNTTSWQSFELPDISLGGGLCHNLLDPGSLPSKAWVSG